MQIHELNNFTGTLGAGAYLAIDDGTDTGKISSQGLLAATEARIDNIIAGPAPSAQEVTDARLGADGVTYSSLGTSIRSQVTDLKSDLSDETSARILLAGRVTTAESDIDTLETHKVAQPLDGNNQPTNGTSGQSLRTKGDGTTEWADVGLPTDAQTAQAVSDWLDDHPEATTTVQDGSLTETKFSNALKLKTIKDYVTPEMFGAVGDGIADDTYAIQSAFNNSNNVYIPIGTYKITDTITLNDNTNVLCDGIIKKAGQFNYMFVLGNNNNIQLKIDNNEQSALTIESETSCDIVAINKSNILIHDSIIQNTDSRYAVHFYGCTNTKFVHNTIDTYVYAGVICSDGCRNIHINFNSIINGHGTTIQRYPICLCSEASQESDVTIGAECIGNYIEDLTPSWEGIDAHGLNDAVISNNVIINTATGIAVVNANNNIGKIINVSISNNVYRRTASFEVVANSVGISCSCVNGSKNIKINDNVIQMLGDNTSISDGAKSGIYLIGFNGIVDGNIIELNSFGYGIYDLVGALQNGTDFIYTNNKISNGVAGFYFQNADRQDIRGDVYDNTIIGCTTGVIGNNDYGTYGAYYNRVFCRGNQYIDCDTEYTNNQYGTYHEFQVAYPAKSVGRKNDIVYNSNVGATGQPIKWICTKTAKNQEPAIWVVAGVY